MGKLGLIQICAFIDQNVIVVDKGPTVPVYSQCRPVILLCITYIDINVNHKPLRSHANDFYILFLRFKDEAVVMYIEVIQDHSEHEIKNQVSFIFQDISAKMMMLSTETFANSKNIHVYDISKLNL